MEIEMSPEHLLLANEGQMLRVRGVQIERVFVYKQDLFIYDRIAAAVTFADGGSVELHEEMLGWKQFVDNLPQYLPNCRDFSDWFMEVAFPAFELKPMLIFRRASEIN